MKNVMTLLFLLIALPVLRGQGAKVVQLSPEDAARAKSLSEEQKALDAKTAAFREVIKQKYLTTLEEKERGSCYAGPSSLPLAFITTEVGSFGNLTIKDDGRVQAPSKKPNTPSKSEPYYRQGWGCGEYQYSDDFKFIVPVAEPAYKPAMCSNFYTTN